MECIIILCIHLNCGDETFVTTNGKILNKIILCSLSRQKCPFIEHYYVTVFTYHIASHLAVKSEK